MLNKNILLRLRIFTARIRIDWHGDTTGAQLLDCKILNYLFPKKSMIKNGNIMYIFLYCNKNIH